MSIEQVLDFHLNSVKNRDLDAFSSTLVQDDRLTLIMPNGNALFGYDAIVDFHKNWFADPDWTLQTTLLKLLQADTSATALLEVTYHDLDASAQPYQLSYLLSLTFIQHDGEWRLLFDQNTLTSK